MGLILPSRRDEILFRHPTRQLTSSAKAKEVHDRLTHRCFFAEFFSRKHLEQPVFLMCLQTKKVNEKVWETGRKGSFRLAGRNVDQ